MTGDGGLIALSLADVRLLEEWATSTKIHDDWASFDEELLTRLQEWRTRHTPEDAT